MRIVMMGTGRFAVPTFEALLCSRFEVAGLVTQPDRATGTESGTTRLSGQTMKDIALKRGLPVLQPESINTTEGVSQLAALNPELLVVAAYGQILSKEALGVASLGGINVHASLLPKYRGAAPIAWAIFHGECETGVTIIRMSVALDAGDMLAQGSLSIGPEETAGELEARLARLGAELAIATVERMASGPVTGTSQDKSQATKAPKLTKEHGLIDWSKPADAICRQVRAMQPWPTAYSFLQRENQPALRVIISRASSASGSSGALAGSILPGDKNQLLVAAGVGAVEIHQLQPAGKKIQTAAEFLRGYRSLPGDRFGPP